MKKVIITMLAFISICSCGNKQQASDLKVEKKTQAEYVQSWVEQGIDNFSFDEEGFLVYKVSRSEVAADPYWVAQQNYEMAADVEGVKGCRLVDEEGNEVGRYEP